MPDIYQELKDAGQEISNHESDLYTPVNETTKKIIDRYEFKQNVKTFRSQIDGKVWYDIPFQYTPFYEKKLVREMKNNNREEI